MMKTLKTMLILAALNNRASEDKPFTMAGYYSPDEKKLVTKTEYPSAESQSSEKYEPFKPLNRLARVFGRCVCLLKGHDVITEDGWRQVICNYDGVTSIVYVTCKRCGALVNAKNLTVKTDDTDFSVVMCQERR